MLHIASYQYLGGRIDWEKTGYFGEVDDDGLTIHLGFQTHSSPTRRESLRSTAENLTRNRVEWFSLRGNRWRVNLDKLKSDFELGDSFAWLTGEVMAEPEFDTQPAKGSFGRPAIDVSIRLVFEKATLQEMLENPEEKRARLFDERALHQDIGQRCRQLFIDGHFRQSVLDGCLHISDTVRTRTGISDEDGQGLMGRVFASR